MLPRHCRRRYRRASPGKGWPRAYGTIEGKVVFSGAVPTRKIIPNKDVEVCGQPREEPLVPLV